MTRVGNLQIQMFLKYSKTLACAIVFFQVQWAAAQTTTTAPTTTAPKACPMLMKICADGKEAVMRADCSFDCSANRFKAPAPTLPEQTEGAGAWGEGPGAGAKSDQGGF